MDVSPAQQAPPTRSPRSSPAAGFALPGTLTVRAYALRQAELPLPRRPAPAARPLRGVDPQDRREDRHPPPHRRRARRLAAPVRQREEIRALLAELQDLTLEIIEASPDQNNDT